MRQRARILALFLPVVIIGAASQYARAANLKVDCDKHESISKALHLVAIANPQGPNTITVSGGCKGNFVIRSMDRLTLMTKNGASLTDGSSGSLAVVDIEDSQKVTPARIHHQRRGPGNPMQYRQFVLPDGQHDSRSGKVWCKCN
jgi:hypothetical protein